MQQPDNSEDTLAISGRTILQIIPRLEAGGAERTVIDMARAIVAAGGRAVVVAEPGRMVSELETAGGEFIPMSAASKNPFRMLQTAVALVRLIRHQKVDLVHARSRAPAWPALWAARWTSRPFVTTYHGIYSQTNALKAFYNSVMARGDAVIANSGMTAALIAQRRPQAKPRIKTIYRGIDMDAFAPDSISLQRRDAVRQQWSFQASDTNRPLILNVARLTGWKGHEVLIEAMGRLLEGNRQQNPLLILAGGSQGDSTFETHLQQLIEARGLTGHIRLVGHCDDVPAALTLATCLVVASTREEAFGRAAVEAGAAGIPAIATDHGGARETILAPPEAREDERTGWRVPPGDAAAMADVLATVLAMSDESRAAAGQHARNYVAARFSLEAMCTQTLRVYGALLQTKRRTVN